MKVKWSERVERPVITLYPRNRRLRETLRVDDERDLGEVAEGSVNLVLGFGRRTVCPGTY